MTAGFEPPVYPYERLAGARAKADAHEGGLVDLSVGTPGDPPPPAAVSALSSSGTERGYPMSVGSPAYRGAARGWMSRRFGVDVPVDAVAACIGTKELVATLPQWLRLRSPDRDTVLHPGVAYPTYEMGAILAGCRSVAVPVDDRWQLDLDAIDDADAERALALWVNSPANPTGALHDLSAVAAWGRARGVPVLSDECYTELTWEGRPRTILEDGLDGVIAVHSLSKTFNLAGLRAGFYAGDPELVRYLSEVRKHAGMLVAGPVQAAAAVALADDEHASAQRERYRQRLERFREILAAIEVRAPMPAGGLYLWVAAPEEAGRPGGEPDSEELTARSWAFTERLAADGGVLVSPGDLYGPQGAGYVRVALVQPMERLDLVARRLGVG
ncbi:MAG TPA: aminotransferase class I/II-fold pyridoxal phosphate-dependent enzyme [Acidimicrobiales bacterium]|nr:aminotransferase class I/II-fold pyridoxal phosphate-dependent enzyme [Acidimicrobiales bacterium]